MKDNFSTASDNYAKYRPRYPKEFFIYLNTILPNRNYAWDCGTGNGQVAVELSPSFKTVFATDISHNQIKNAEHKDNIQYSVETAEQSHFEDSFFDLIIVAQAIHWFNFEKFYEEVNRTIRPDGIFCVLGYNRPTVTQEIDQELTTFYHDKIGEYWDPERHYIDDEYQTIPFPFHEITSPTFSLELNWDLNHYLSYINTWSAVKKFIAHKGYNPVDDLQKVLKECWNDYVIKKVNFPLFIRIGKPKAV